MFRIFRISEVLEIFEIFERFEILEIFEILKRFEICLLFRERWNSKQFELGSSAMTCGVTPRFLQLLSFEMFEIVMSEMDPRPAD